MFALLIWDMTSAIFSRESEDGASLSGSPDGRRTGPSGREAVPASRTAPPESSAETPTNAICGRSSSALSRSGGLNSSLASRLKTLFGTDGSIEYVETWKEKATPSGRRYWAHTASGRRTAVSVSTGELFPFHTPRASDGTNGGPGQGGGALYPDAASAVVCAWLKTPTAGDAEGGVMEIRPGTTGKYKLRDYAATAVWMTCKASDGEFTTPRTSGRPPEKSTHPQTQVAVVAAWSTASARDWKDTPGMRETVVNPDGTVRRRIDLLPRMAYQVFLPGRDPSLSSAGTGKCAGYRLNPYFSAWLMGFPKAWTDAGLRAFRKLAAFRLQRKERAAQCC